MTDDKTQRPFAKFYRAIWTDDEFKSLDSGPQRMFMLLLSQPTITLAGTMPLQVNKWSRLAADTPSELLLEHLAALTERCFVVVDEDTEELLIRTVMKNDTLWNRSPKTQLGVLRHCLKVESPLIRLTLADEIESCLSMFTTANDVDQQAHTALSALREHASEHGSEHASANHQVKQPKSPPPADTEHASEHASEHVSKLPHTSYLIPHTSDRTSSETYVGKRVVGGNPYQRAYNCVQEPDELAADPWADVPDPSRSPTEPPTAGLDEESDSAESARATPRELGTNPRALGTNPRATGTNPRALGTNPRALGTNPKASQEPPSAGLDEKNELDSETPCDSCSGFALPGKTVCDKCLADQAAQVAASRSIRRRT